jgi:hypothetical protein
VTHGGTKDPARVLRASKRLETVGEYRIMYRIDLLSSLHSASRYKLQFLVSVMIRLGHSSAVEMYVGNTYL